MTLEDIEQANDLSIELLKVINKAEEQGVLENVAILSLMFAMAYIYSTFVNGGFHTFEETVKIANYRNQDMGKFISLALKEDGYVN